MLLTSNFISLRPVIILSRFQATQFKPKVIAPWFNTWRLAFLNNVNTRDYRTSTKIVLKRRGRGSLNEYPAGNNIQYYHKCSKDESWEFKISSSHIAGTTRFHENQKAGNTLYSWHHCHCICDHLNTLNSGCFHSSTWHWFYLDSYFNHLKSLLLIHRQICQLVNPHEVTETVLIKCLVL